MAEYKYSAYGLTISSPLPCPVFFPGEGEVDVHIRYGIVPHHISDVESEKKKFLFSPNTFRFFIKGVAKYLISNGNEIVIERVPKVGDDEVRLFLFSSAIGAIIHQRGFLPIHGSGIVVDGRCITFSGISGAGKSTLAAAFQKKGYKIIADDICVLTHSPNKQPMVFPGYPQLKLYADVLEKIGENKKDLLPISPGQEKYALPISETFLNKATPLESIYIISFRKKKEFKLTPIKGKEKVLALKENTYHNFFMKRWGEKAGHLKRYVELAKKVNVYHVDRPMEIFLLDEFVKFLEDGF